jgi:hypothetical protein
MGIDLHDNETNEVVFSVNFWHYRAIVEAIRSLDVLPDAKVESLHESWCGHGLSIEEARLVGSNLRQRVLPQLAQTARLMLGGEVTACPDDGVLHRGEDQHLNYSTNAEVLLRFILCCETSNGFTVC